MCYHILWANEGAKNGSQMIIPVETECTLFLEESDIMNFCFHGENSPLCPGKARVQWPNHLTGNHGEGLCHTTTGSHSGLPMEYPKGNTESVSNHWLSFNVTEWLHGSIDIHPVFLEQLGWFCLGWHFCSQHRGALVLKCPSPNVSHMNLLQSECPDGGIFSTFLVISLMGCSCRLSEKEYPCRVFSTVSHKPVFQISNGKYQMNEEY